MHRPPLRDSIYWGLYYWLFSHPARQLLVFSGLAHLLLTLALAMAREPLLGLEPV